VQAPGVLRKELQRHVRTRRVMRRARGASGSGQGRGQIKDCVSIHNRPEEAAERLGVTPRMIRRLTASWRLPFVKVGRLVRSREVDIVHFVDEWTVPAVERSWSA